MIPPGRDSHVAAEVVSSLSWSQEQSFDFHSHSVGDSLDAVVASFGSTAPTITSSSINLPA
jgi:hypothetical protein